jgi:hypothetical protein
MTAIRQEPRKPLRQNDFCADRVLTCAEQMREAPMAVDSMRFCEICIVRVEPAAVGELGISAIPRRNPRRRCDERRCKKYLCHSDNLHRDLMRSDQKLSITA